jgi:hypothetical protein
MAKLADNITNILAAAGVKLTDEQKAVLAELPQDEVSATVQSLFDTATNQATSELAKIAQKAGNLDKFDESIAGWADILGDDVKTLAKEKGLQKLDKVKALLSKKIEEAKTAAAGGEGDLTKLRNEITTLTTKVQTLESEKIAEVEKVKGEYESKIFNSTLLTKLQGRNDVVEAFRSPDALKMLVLPKVLDFIKGKGLEIKPDTLDVINAETKVPHQKGAKPVTLDEMFEEALSENKFRQNSGPNPPRTTVEVDGNGNTPRVTAKSFLKPDPIES